MAQWCWINIYTLNHFASLCAKWWLKISCWLFRCVKHLKKYGENYIFLFFFVFLFFFKWWYLNFLIYCIWGSIQLKYSRNDTWNSKSEKSFEFSSINNKSILDISNIVQSPTLKKIKKINKKVFHIFLGALHNGNF